MLSVHEIIERALRERIQAALGPRARRDDPFPHVVIDDFLPPWIFQALEASFPSDETFDRAGKPTSRGRANFQEGQPEFTNLLNQSDAWAGFENAVHSRWFQEALMSPFLETLGAHGCRWRPSYGTSATLHVSKAGDAYQRSPHIDNRHRLVAGLLYFNSVADFAKRGGDFWLVDGRGLPENLRRQRFLEWEEVVDAPVTKVSPAPNRFVAFLNTSEAYHAVDRLEAAGARRAFCYLALDGVTTESDLWPELAVDDERILAFRRE